MLSPRIESVSLFAVRMPQISRVQSRKQALPGPMRVGLEGSTGAWPGDNPNDCAQQFSCPNPSLIAMDPFVPAGNRFIEIAAGGPNTFAWTLDTTAPWVKFSQAKGTSTAKSADARVFLSVDWSKMTGSSD